MFVFSASRFYVVHFSGSLTNVETWIQMCAIALKKCEEGKWKILTELYKVDKPRYSHAQRLHISSWLGMGVSILSFLAVAFEKLSWYKNIDIVCGF